MVWGSGGLKSCSRLLDRAESGELTELIILPAPLKQFTEQDAKRLSQILRQKNCRVTTLIIPHSLSSESTQLIGSSILTSSVTYLDLGNHTFGDDGAMALAQGISQVCVNSESLDLETLLLNKKGMTSVGMGALGEALAFCCPNLQQLDLSDNTGVTSFFAKALGKATELGNNPFPSIQSLNLTNCGISSSSDHECLTQFISLQQPDNEKFELNLSKNKFSEIGWLQNCVAIEGVVTNLDLSCNSLENIFFEQRTIVEGHCRLSKINLSQCQLTSSHLQQLLTSGEGEPISLLSCCSSSLTHLDLSGNPLIGKDNSAVQMLVDSLTNVSSLDMSQTNIQIDSAIKILTSWKQQIKELRLFGNSLKDDGCRKILPFITDTTNSVLESLDLSGNHITSDGLLELLQIVSSIPSNSPLKLLEIGGNETNPQVLEKIDALREQRPHLDIAHDKTPNNSNPELK